MNQGTPRTARAPAAALAAAMALPMALAVVLAVAAPAAADDIPIQPLPIYTPSASGSVGLPDQSTSPLPGVGLYVPGLEVPGTCNVQPCRAPVVVQGATVSTQPVPGQSLIVPDVVVQDACAPGGLVCATGRRVEGQQLGPTPTLEGQQHTVPDLLVPAACDVLGEVCDSRFATERREVLTTPEAGAVPLTPAVGASFALPGFAATLGPGIVVVGSQGPVPLGLDLPLVGPAGIVLCQASCPQPGVVVPLSPRGSIDLTVAVGERTATLPDL